LDFVLAKSVHRVARACRSAKEAAMSKPKAEKKGKQEPKSKKERAPKEPQVVFAFRLSEADRDRIHKAAGPGRATKFVLAAALAAASGDEKAFKTLVESGATKQ
jgi:hypothetical protein